MGWELEKWGETGGNGAQTGGTGKGLGRGQWGQGGGPTGGKRLDRGRRESLEEPWRSRWDLGGGLTPWGCSTDPRGGEGSLLPPLTLFPPPVPPALPCQLHPSPLKRSLALVPGSPQPPGPGGDWGGPEEPPAAPPAPRGAPPAFGEHAPLSPQSSVASSGSEHTEEPGGRNSFQEDGSGMKDVPSWLKSLRLHKYAALFAQMSYEEMMTLTERHLESQNVTKGARHKIALSIQKLRERQSVLRALEKDILEGGNLWTALQELQQILVTPIKAFRPPPAAPPPPGPAPDGTPAPPDGTPAPPEAFAPPPEAEPPAAAVPDGDIPGQFTRVMGKVCTQLLVSRPDEENITTYLQLLEKCLSHEAFTETQKKRLQSWKQQVLKLLRAFPKKGPLDGPPGYRPPKSWAFGSNSLPIAGSVGGGAAGGGGPAPSRCPPGPCPPPPAWGCWDPPGGRPEPPWERPPPRWARRDGRASGSGPGGARGGPPGAAGPCRERTRCPCTARRCSPSPRVQTGAGGTQKMGRGAQKIWGGGTQKLGGQNRGEQKMGGTKNGGIQTGRGHKKGRTGSGGGTKRGGTGNGKQEMGTQKRGSAENGERPQKTERDPKK
uniref:SAM domain-containing protein n=1 Tax=Catharus ustulatus TaxID=91951 RepID=A0A8C3UCH0_CATUS